mmetsp:Transcript_3969/g.9418  ORF Transcript_3969/g.9418 Transcript_3969/m.9418 type:complete len:217 (-) Transcript_3969:322-972(-)
MVMGSSSGVGGHCGLGLRLLRLVVVVPCHDCRLEVGLHLLVAHVPFAEDDTVQRFLADVLDDVLNVFLGDDVVPLHVLGMVRPLLLQRLEDLETLASGELEVDSSLLCDDGANLVNQANEPEQAEQPQKHDCTRSPRTCDGQLHDESDHSQDGDNKVESVPPRFDVLFPPVHVNLHGTFANKHHHDKRALSNENGIPAHVLNDIIEPAQHEEDRIN